MSFLRPCNRSFLPLCSIPARMSKDGYAGPNAKIYLPFSTQGLYFFSGAQMSTAEGTLPQDRRRYIGGVFMPNTYTKQGFV